MAALLMGFILYGGSGAGLSNNGDYSRIMKSNDLKFVTPLNVPYVYQAQFRMDLSEKSIPELLFSLDNTEGYPSVHLLFTRASMAANLALNALTGAPIETYRVQVLGLMYLLCYAGLFFLLFRSFSLPRPGMDLLVKLLMLFVLCDEGYITYFNSLYSEPVQILGLLALCVFALRALTNRGRLSVNAICFFLSATIYGWAKFVNLPAGALCILCFGVLFLRRATKRQKAGFAAAALLCVAVLGTVYASLPKWMDDETNYNAVFFGVLKDTDEARRAACLDELGLPQSMGELANSTFYAQRGVEGRADGTFYQSFHVSKFDLLFFYLKHSGYFLQKLDAAMGHSGFIRPYYLSNLGEDAVRLSFANRFGGWSYLRGQLPFNTWVLNGLLLLGACVSLGLLLSQNEEKRRWLPGALAALAILGSAAYQFFMPIITNGEADLAKHMFAFAQIVDLALLYLIARLGVWLCERKRLKYPTPVLAAGLALAVSLGLLAPIALRQIRFGGTVTLGSWDGKPITWQVAAHEDGKAILLATDPVVLLPFSDGGADGFGSSLWTGSALRAWLNGDFLENAFTEEERALIQTEEHRVLLSSAHKEEADSGWNDFFAFHVPRYSDRGMAEAFGETVSDAVRLPDIALLASLSREGRLAPAECWMETPYYNNGSMLRTLGSDGYFYMRDAAAPYGVRPVVVLSELP